MFFPIPDFKGFDFFPHGTRLPFMKFKGLCFVVSLLCMGLSLGLFFTRGLNYGVDFVGGSLIEVQSKSGPADLADIRTKLSALNVGDVQIQSFGSETDVLIRVQQQPGGEAEQQAAMNQVINALGPDFVQRRVEVVGPAVSSELRRTSIIALIASLLAVSAYVWFRFDWQFAVGVIISLIHDVLVTVGIFSLFFLEFDLSIVAALLTIVGYSMNDSVVVSDRIRENLRKFKRMELNELLDVSINETLSRTIMTGFTAIAGIVALLVFGGEVIRNFSLTMLLGIIIGTYSSIFIAAPLLGYIGIRRETFVGGGKAAPAAPIVAPATSGGSARAKAAAVSRPPTAAPRRG